MSWAIEHKGLICKIAHLVHRRATSAGATVDVDDLIQDGAEISIKAERTFDAALGLSATTYLQTSLLRGLNRLTDKQIQNRRFEQPEDDLPEYGRADSLHTWDFVRGLSSSAQQVMTGYLEPTPVIRNAMSDLKVGRRNSFQAYLRYLRDQNPNSQRIDAIEREIMQRVEQYA